MTNVIISTHNHRGFGHENPRRTCAPPARQAPCTWSVCIVAHSGCLISVDRTAEPAVWLRAIRKLPHMRTHTQRTIAGRRQNGRPPADNVQHTTNKRRYVNDDVDAGNSHLIMQSMPAAFSFRHRTSHSLRVAATHASMSMLCLKRACICSYYSTCFSNSVVDEHFQRQDQTLRSIGFEYVDVGLQHDKCLIRK